MPGHRANWKGHIRFGDVSFPVALYTAASTAERIAFHTLNRKTGNRVKREFVDSETSAIVDREGNPVPLTGTEFALLHALVEHPGQVLTRDQLMNHLHGRDAGPFDRAIDVHIGRLRRKLERDPARPQLIQSSRGMGYRLATTVTCS